jgi:hypothetical protein
VRETLTREQMQIMRGKPSGTLRRRASGVRRTTYTTGRGAGPNDRRSPRGRSGRTRPDARTCRMNPRASTEASTPARIDDLLKPRGGRAGPRVVGRPPGQYSTRMHDRAHRCASRITLFVRAGGRSKPQRSGTTRPRETNSPFAHRTLQLQYVRLVARSRRNGTTAPTFEQLGLAGCLCRREARRAHARNL